MYARVRSFCSFLCKFQHIYAFLKLYCVTTPLTRGKSPHLGKQRIACGKERRPKEVRSRTAVRASTRAFPYIRIERNDPIRGAGQASSLRSSKTGDVFMHVNRMVAVHSARSSSPQPDARMHFVGIPGVAPARAPPPQRSPHGYQSDRRKPLAHRMRGVAFRRRNRCARARRLDSYGAPAENRR